MSRKRYGWTLLFVSFLAASCKSKSGSDAPPEADEAPTNVQRADVTEAATGDLDAIVARGELRILVRRSEAAFLPRAGMPGLRDLENAEAFAEWLGVTPVFVLVDRYGDLIPALVEGRGDLVAAQLTVTEARKKKVAFARSTLGVEEIVVGKKGVEGLPRSIEALKGWPVLVRKSSSYASSLKAAAKKHELAIVEAPEGMDTEAIVESITAGDGKRLTVVDSHLLAAFETYNPDIEPLFSLKDRREISWAVRKEDVALRAALDRFVIERSMTKRSKAVQLGDLDAIKERGVLRVLTRNNAASYFLYRGEERGFDYELAQRIAKALDVRLQMVVPPSRSQLVPWLLEGRGDVIAAQMTATERRRAKVAFSTPYLFTTEVLAKKAGADGPEDRAALAGLEVHVRPSSSYRATVEELNARGIALKVVDVPGSVETATLLQRVADDEIGYTIADRHLLDIERTYGVEVDVALELGDEPRPIAFAVRPGDEALKTFLDAFVEEHYRGVVYNILVKRYFENEHSIADFQAKRVATTKKLSPFDPLIQKYAEKYGIDWRLMAAQAYVESRFDPNAKSWVGAKGLFQVMPKTGAAMGFTKLEIPAVGIHAGIKYMARLLKRFDPKLPFAVRMRFALAAYNVGLGHVLDARRLAAREGMDPDKWFGNVENALLLLSQKKYAARARHGYCRGGQPVAYVAHIQSLYDAYVRVTE